MQNKTLLSIIFAIIVLILGTSCSVSKQEEGEMPSVLIFGPENSASDIITVDSMEIAKKILKKRLNTVFAEKTDIQIVDYTIHVGLNNTQNASVITQLATNMGTLIFFDSTVPFSAGKKIPNDVNIILANADIAAAKTEYNKYIERWEVQLTFTPDGTKKFTKYTRENINHYLVIAKDGIVIMAPQIMMEIPDGQATITAGESDGKSNTEMDFKILAAELNSGPFPFPLIIIETNQSR